MKYAHWFMSIRISHMKDHSISLDQAKYATYIVAKYLNTATVKTSTKFYKTTFPDIGSGLVTSQSFQRSNGLH